MKLVIAIAFTLLAFATLAQHARADTCKFDSTPAALSAAATQEVTALINEATTGDSTGQALATKLQQKLASKLTGSGADTSTLTVSGKRRVTIQLANPPPTRLRLSLDSNGRHVEVEWDPTVSTDLARTVTLDDGAWAIVASVEPSTYTQQAGSVIIHTRFGAVTTAAASDKATSTLEGYYVALVAALNVTAGTDERPMLAWPRPQLKFTCGDLPSLEDAQFAPAPAAANASGLRGFGVAPSVVTDTLSILAEIAVERAKAGAMKALQRRLVNPFCKDESKITLAKLGFGHSDELALPRTCELLLSLRLEDALSSGRPLLIALRDDLRLTIAPAALTRLADNDPIANTLLQSILALANGAIDRGGVDAIDAQLMLEFLGNVEKIGVDLYPQIIADLDDALRQTLGTSFDDIKPFANAFGVTCTENDISGCASQIVTKLDTFVRHPLSGDVLDNPQLVTILRGLINNHQRANDIVGFACQARLAVAAIKRCQHDGCAAQDVAGMITTPEKYFSVDTKLPLALCWKDDHTFRAPPQDIVALQQMVVDGIRLVAPVVDGKGRERAKATVKLLVDLLHRWRGNEKVDHYARAFSEIAYALIDEDYGTALNAFLRLADEVQPARVPAPVHKFVELIGAVSSYALVYKETKDEDPKAAREARKKALESLIDHATDRTDRDGETIYSIGSNVGLSLGWTDAFDQEDKRFEHWSPALRVPLGVGIDVRETHHVALHLDLQLADLGQFVHPGDQADDVQWSDFVSPGLGVGFSVPWLDRALNVSVYTAYAPSGALEDNSAPHGIWRYGVSLGYYVPFFDFN